MESDCWLVSQAYHNYTDNTLYALSGPLTYDFQRILGQVYWEEFPVPGVYGFRWVMSYWSVFSVEMLALLA